MTGLSTVGPVGAHDVRAANLGVVLRAIRRAAPCSRAEVAATTTLTKATVSSLVGQLIEHRVVREVGSSEGRVGRPAIQLALDDRWTCAIGLEVNVDYLTLVAIDLTERVLVSRHEPFDAVGSGPRACAERLAELVVETQAEPSLARRATIGVTVAVPGLIDATNGTVTTAPNLKWSDVPLREHLARRLRTSASGVPVFVDNDAHLAAIAEYRHGHRAGTPDLAYLTGEVGIGAGILVGGRLLRGHSGHSGEIGHIPLVVDGPRCGCGRNGCLEALAGIDTIVRGCLPQDVAPTTGPRSAAELGRTVELVAARAAAGERTTVETLGDAGGWLGRGIATLVNLVSPRVVILGGYFVPLAPWLLPSCRAAVGDHAIAAAEGSHVIETSTLGFGAAAQGAAAAVVDSLDRGSLGLPVYAGAD
ncbi:ROK family protein [Spiractinospora alimapuensis]|nr:ROK family protein [Spiractinospora alimapuensis]QVQ55070.1 ROK family protein [Spiractinospora alimapuensis]